MIATLKDGFGFITCAEREARMFFHFSEMLEPDTEIKCGDEVEFTVIQVNISLAQDCNICCTFAMVILRSHAKSLISKSLLWCTYVSEKPSYENICGHWSLLNLWMLVSYKFSINILDFVFIIVIICGHCVFLGPHSSKSSDCHPYPHVGQGHSEPRDDPPSPVGGHRGKGTWKH